MKDVVRTEANPIWHDMHGKPHPLCLRHIIDVGKNALANVLLHWPIICGQCYHNWDTWTVISRSPWIVYEQGLMGSWFKHKWNCKKYEKFKHVISRFGTLFHQIFLTSMELIMYLYYVHDNNHCNHYYYNHIVIFISIQKSHRVTVQLFS